MGQFEKQWAMISYQNDEVSIYKGVNKINFKVTFAYNFNREQKTQGI